MTLLTFYHMKRKYQSGYVPIRQGLVMSRLIGSALADKNIVAEYTNRENIVRYCYECKSMETQVKYGKYQQWFRFGIHEWQCHKCYARKFWRRKYNWKGHKGLGWRRNAR